MSSGGAEAREKDHRRITKGVIERARQWQKVRLNEQKHEFEQKRILVIEYWK
jgi:hypothetical protein